MKVSLRDIRPNPMQPRRKFDKRGLKELAESIENVGLVQPIVVEEISPGKYFIIDGERRFRACQMIKGVGSIDVVIKERLPDDGRERLLQAVVANVQREDLNPVEEGRAYKKMQTEFGFSINRISQMTGKALMTVKARIELLDLDDETLSLVEKNKLPVDRRIVLALLSLPEDIRHKVTSRMIQNDLTIKAALKVIEKIQVAIESGDGKPWTHTRNIPAIAIAEKKTIRNRRTWGLLQQVGKAPSWELLVQAAESTCNECSLRDLANETICGECPAVFLVTNLMKDAK